MNTQKLERTLNRIKEHAKMDYAVTNTDFYGDCNTCVNDELGMTYGYSSTGVFLKHWLHGMNKGKPIEQLQEVYIAHDITAAQADILIREFTAAGYDILPKVYDRLKCFLVSETTIKEE